MLNESLNGFMDLFIYYALISNQSERTSKVDHSKYTELCVAENCIKFLGGQKRAFFLV